MLALLRALFLASFAFVFATRAASFSYTASTAITSTAVRLPKPFSGSSSLREKSPTTIFSMPLILSSLSSDPLGLRLSPTRRNV